MGVPELRSARTVRANRADPDAYRPYYMSFPSAKDPTWKLRHADTATIELVSRGHEQFRPWENEPLDERGESYDALKKRYTDRLLDTRAPAMNRARSPTWRHAALDPHFSNHPRGEVYGVEARRFRMVIAPDPVPGPVHHRTGRRGPRDRRRPVQARSAAATGDERDGEREEAGGVEAKLWFRLATDSVSGFRNHPLRWPVWEGY